MTDDRDFKISTDVFEGPLDLLLSLIEKRKLLINDISLAKVTDDYISHVKEMEKFSLNKTSHFILIASTLLLIKSKSLLPSIDLTPEEEHDISELETRLKIYQIYKNASENVLNKFCVTPMFDKQEVKNQTVVFASSKQINLKDIHSAILNVIKSIPKVEKVPEAVIKKVISIEEMINKLTFRIQDRLKMSFKEFAGDGGLSKLEKVDIIVSFLAMLELVRQDVLKVDQENKYGDINMETRSVSVPKYN